MDDDENENLIIGSNYRLTELQAVIAIEQIKKLDEVLKTRKELAYIFNEKISQCGVFNTFTHDEISEHGWYLFPMPLKESNSKLRDKLSERINVMFDKEPGQPDLVVKGVSL